VPKPIKLLEGIRNGALIWSTAILWTNDQCFILWLSIRLSTCRFIFRAHAGAHRSPNANFGLSDWS